MHTCMLCYEIYLEQANLQRGAPGQAPRAAARALSPAQDSVHRRSRHISLMQALDVLSIALSTLFIQGVDVGCCIHLLVQKALIPSEPVHAEHALFPTYATCVMHRD